MNKTVTWQPSAPLQHLQYRAQLLQKIRGFFHERHFLEVETPILARTTASDPHIESIQIKNSGLYLQTSPEFHMKRLLAAGSGPIFQITKVFRGQESGKAHNPEFTMLEWYNFHSDHHALMDEMDAFLAAVSGLPSAERHSYRAVFEKNLDIDPHHATSEMLQACALQQGINATLPLDDAHRNDWLDLLFSHIIQPQLGLNKPMYVYDYPASQAALAKVVQKDTPVAARFEVFLGGIEIANGYDELQDHDELKRRFEHDINIRQQIGLPIVPVDERLIAAHQAGLSQCAGVALGVDRLLMFLLKQDQIAQVISFSIEKA